MRSFTLYFACMLATFSLFAQRIKSDKFDYKYIKLPAEPIDKSIKSYQSAIYAPFEVENQRLRNEYEAEKIKAEEDYQRDLAAYPELVKAADEKYAKEMEAWKKKSLVDKIVEKEILNENNKPQKPNVNKPYKRNVPEPQLKKSYDFNALASTYLQLEGFEKNTQNAVQIVATLNGFEYIRPKQVTEVKKVTTAANGNVTTNDVTYYSIEFSYRHTMSVKAVLPDGREILNLSPQELNTYKVYKSNGTTTSQPIVEDQLVRTYEEKILQENLTLLGNLVNDKIGYKREQRNAVLEYPVDKKVNYSDMLQAYNEALSGLMSISVDEESAKSKINKAIELWNTALKESDVNDKKARIDKDITISIYFNMLECYFATRNIAEADKVFSALGGIQISNADRKTKEKFETLFVELRKRVSVN
jgi:hypothetical protein